MWGMFFLWVMNILLLKNINNVKNICNIVMAIFQRNINRTKNIYNMQHLDFILWMILFPVSISLCGYLDSLKNNGVKTVYSKTTELLSIVVYFLIWILIAIKLY